MGRMLGIKRGRGLIFEQHHSYSDLRMLKTTIGGSIELDCCVFNASGPRTGSIEALKKIAESRAGAILSKSSTLVKQDGNELPRFVNRIDLGESCQGSGIFWLFSPLRVLSSYSPSPFFFQSTSIYPVHD